MKNEAQLFPYLLVRVAGGSHTEFAKMELKSTVRVVEKIQKINEHYDKLKEKISKKLYTFIPTLSDRQVRHLLIKARRDVHNGRSIDYLSNDILTTLPQVYKKLFTSYNQTHKKLEGLSHQGNDIYKKEYSKSKKIFLRLIKQQDFKKGILLASSTLPESFEKYLREDHDFTKPISKLERSLIEYLSRFYTKPSPFSTFAHVGVATIDDKENPNKMIPQSHVKLNHLIYGYLFSLLIQQESLRKKLVIECNLTIKKDKEQFVFLTNNNNNEALQRITVTPGLQMLYDLLQTKSGWVYDEFISKIISGKIIDVTIEGLENYIDRLLELGFITFDLGVSGADSDWDKKLSQKLIPLSIKFPILNTVIQALKRIRKLSFQYEKASEAKRKLLLQESFSLLKETCENFKKEGRIGYKKQKRTKKDAVFLHTYETLFPFKPNNIWYEDSTMPKNFYLLSTIRENLDVLSKLLSSVGGLDACAEQRIVMTDFFKNHYATNAKISLLEFYEAYYKEKNHSRGTLFAERIKNNNQWFGTLLSHLKDKVQDTDQINISADDVPQNISLYRPGAKISFGAFFQIHQNIDSSTIVVNNTAPGFGKMFSRFLYVLPEDITNALRLWNKSKNNSVLLAEPTDASLFNGGIHPSLFPYEIHVPGGNSVLSEKKWIELANMQVAYDIKINRLILIDKEQQKEIFIFDMSLQNTEVRSKLYSLLSVFSPCDHHELRELQYRINTMAKKLINEHITVYPRIVYENNIVLQRKTWELSPKYFPKKETKENDWAYFLKINTWRKKFGIPDEIFVKTHKSKPQHISFYNPFLVGLLGRMGEKNKNTLQISEMLPNTKYKSSVGGGGIITEFFTQWYL